MCFKCFSPDCCSNYSIGKTATEKLLDVQRLLHDETTKAVAITSVPPPVQEEPGPTLLVDANPYLEEALYSIKEDLMVGMIGIWGMGGVGKTRLLKQINNSFIGDSSFDVVIFATASQSCTTEKLQKEIAHNQKLQCDGDVSRQAKIIFNFLRKRSFLLLLDNLWERIDLQEVGIPFPLGMVDGCKRKVVLNTRSTTVCGQMEVRKKIKVECLKDHDAWSLFVEKVGDETINSHPRVRSLAKHVVKELEGLPLALITTGRAMYEKKDPKEWKHAIDLLKKSQLDQVEEQSSEGHEKSTFYRLKFSYDSLKSDTLRECFLSCSMWPEDYCIDKFELIGCWMGLGLIKEFDDLSEAYNTGYTLIGDLIAACLLEPDQELDFFVRMHDVLRDMAMWIVVKNKSKWIVLKNEAPRDKEIWHKAERLTLMHSTIRQLPPIAPTLSSSKLTALMLLHNRELRAVGDMGALVAPTYLQLFDCGFVHFPKEICGLVQLQYLNLAENNIPSLPKELGSLVNLKYLILRNTGICTIPHGIIAKLKRLLVLDLHETRGSKGRNLAYMPSPFLEEIECLNDLKGLGICVEDTSQLHRLIALPNISVRWLGISKLDKSTSLSLSASFLGNKQIQTNLAHIRFSESRVRQLVMEGDYHQPTWHLGALESLRIDHMPCLEEIIWNGVVPKELFHALCILRVDNCDKLKNISWILHLPCLTELWISYCSSMRQIITCGADNHTHGENAADIVEKDSIRTSTLPCFRLMFLNHLPEMVSICHSTFAFPALSIIYIGDCPNLKKLPFRPDTFPSKLRCIEGSKSWWERLEWEDSSVRTYLQPFFKEQPQ
ncbi:probable disease resistance protein At1g61300 [Typha latifolia]|uniref:probable disease resistance protein At1g61300 n=1 Tax=Typha latifolia TaxID=4733 RepID=UPI003C2FD78F